MECKLLKKTDYLSQPWKNGKGTTLEIAKGKGDPYLWRISQASLPESATFSPFSGYDRNLTILSGGPVTLKHDTGKKRVLTALSPYSFKGDWKTEAIVESPAEDFNTFALTGKAKAGVYSTYFRSNEEFQYPLAGKEHFIFCVSGTIQIQEKNTEKEFTLAKGECFQLTRDSDKELLNIKAQNGKVESTCLWVVVHLF